MMQEQTTTRKNLTLRKVERPKKPAKIIVRVKSRAPACSSCEIPILHVISKDTINGVRTRDVIQEVRGEKWFGGLNDDDRQARYPSSKKKIVDSVIKYARKNLTLKGDIFPVGRGSSLGAWKITQKGLERVVMHARDWSPRYSTHDAVIIEEEKVGRSC
jgi:hypothetical protein